MILKGIVTPHNAGGATPERAEKQPTNAASLRRAVLLLLFSLLAPGAKAADGRTVWCMGETVTDIVFRGSTVISANVGGSALNTAVSLARAGVKTSFIGETGTDSAGVHILSFIKSEGVGTECLRSVSGIKSSVSLAYLDREGEAHYSFYADQRAPGELPKPSFQKGDILLLSSFFAVSPAYRSDVERILGEARRAGVIIFYDINLRAPHKGMMARLMPALRSNLSAATIVRAGGGDLKTVFGSSHSDSIYRAEIMSRCPRFVRTSSDKSVKIFDGGKLREKVDVEKVKSVSRIGAGDNFNAGFIYAMVRYGVTPEALDAGLSPSLWRKLTLSGLAFSRESCKRIGNYISREFGAEQKAQLK